MKFVFVIFIISENKILFSHGLLICLFLCVCVGFSLFFFLGGGSIFLYFCFVGSSPVK
uniref:NADH dehydrogenase subunit 6 n=1 Tax=Octopus bimaculoides TaxID=37653 RepID=A0A0L8H017_OCTBM